MSLSCRASGKEAPKGGRKRRRRGGRHDKERGAQTTDMVQYWGDKAP